MGIEVTAIEDLMREHGILRRILIVYSESAARFKVLPSSTSLHEPIYRAALLFRAFGENYHEKALEETIIFPALRRIGGEASEYPGILAAQHRKGREITDYILAETKTHEPTDPLQLASVMEAYVRMYSAHAAREDTVVFPGWKQALGPDQYAEMSERFEEIEHERFGEGGFIKALTEISEIEKQLGLADLSQFTTPSI